MGRFQMEIEFQRGTFSLGVRLESRSGRLALLGPSGAGKSSILAALAGLLPVAKGRILVADATWLDTGAGIDWPPSRRRIGIVTQQPSLFPHMSLRENVAFALRCLPAEIRPSRREALRRAAEQLDHLGLSALAQRRPGDVSGGQARRAELARALVAEPSLLLLDEPFTGLDPATKNATEKAFRNLLAASPVNWLLVTHDRQEALGLADEVGIVIDGRVRQVGRAEEVFFRPVDPEVARFLGGELAWQGRVLRSDADMTEVVVGTKHLWAATVVPLEPETTVVATLRPEDVTLWSRPVPAGASSRNQFEACVVETENRGLHVLVRLDAGFPIAALLTRGAASELEPGIGANLGVSFKAMRLHLIPQVKLLRTED